MIYSIRVNVVQIVIEQIVISNQDTYDGQQQASKYSKIQVAVCRLWLFTGVSRSAAPTLTFQFSFRMMIMLLEG
jgi:hypothetical protein